MHRVSLTFDDGPNPRWTPEILRVLGETRPVKATFFVWGEQAAEHEDAIGEIRSAGHSVQPHCWRHLRHPSLSAAQIRADVDRVTALLRRLGAPSPSLWRPPWGQLPKGTSRRIARPRGLAFAGWTADSHDWVGSSGREMYADVRARIAGLNGQEGVVLIHHSYLEPRQAARRSDCAGTVELVSPLIDDDQLTFAPLQDGLLDNLHEQPGGVARLLNATSHSHPRGSR